MGSTAPGPPANGKTPSPPPYEPWPAPFPTPNAVDHDTTHAMDVDSNGADDRDSRAPSAFSIDDLEVAKALTGMREGMLRDSDR